MTFPVLKVDEIGYETVSIEVLTGDITFVVEPYGEIESQYIKIPLADWPEVKEFINGYYQKFITQNSE